MMVQITENLWRRAEDITGVAFYTASEPKKITRLWNLRKFKIEADSKPWVVRVMFVNGTYMDFKYGTREEVDKEVNRIVSSLNVPKIRSVK